MKRRNVFVCFLEVVYKNYETHIWNALLYSLLIAILVGACFVGDYFFSPVMTEKEFEICETACNEFYKNWPEYFSGGAGTWNVNPQVFFESKNGTITFKTYPFTSSSGFSSSLGTVTARIEGETLVIARHYWSFSRFVWLFFYGLMFLVIVFFGVQFFILIKDMIKDIVCFFKWKSRNFNNKLKKLIEEAKEASTIPKNK